MTSRVGAGASRNQTLSSIASSRRREILRLLLAEGSPVAMSDLATHLASTDQQVSTSSGAPAETRSLQTELYHNHLPQLANAGLVRWNREAKTVEMASHPALDDPRFRRLLDAEPEGLDEALIHVANERQRVLLSLLREADAPLTQTDLARELLRAGHTDLDPDSDTVENVITSLHHVHLPALQDDNLVKFDRETDRVTDTNHRGLETIFTIIYDHEMHLVDRYDEFLQGLGEASETLDRTTSEMAGWPHFWGDCHHG